MKRCCRRGINTFVAVLFTLTAVGASSVETRNPLTILFSNSSNGILRACYCPNSPWGGLAKRAWLVEQIRKTVGYENVLLLDAGDLFPAEYDPERIPCLMRLYALMDYDAVAIGDQELTGGLAAWRHFNHLFAANQKARHSTLDTRHSKFPWLSAGYRIKQGPKAGKMLTRPWTIKNVAGHRVGIVSVVGKPAYRFASTKKLAGLKLTDPKNIIDQFVEGYRDKTDVVIVLSHQGIDADRELAKTITGVDLIIGGHSQSLISPPEVINDILICQAGKNGENLGALFLNQTTDKDRKSDIDQTEIEASSPFEPTRAFTPKWRVIQQFIALDTRIDETEEAAEIIDEYYAMRDKRIEERLIRPSEIKEKRPRIIVENPVQYTVIQAGEKKRFTVNLRNAGNAPLEIKKFRSKIRWLKVVDYPEILDPAASGEATLEIHAKDIDRFFRSEYSITSNDKERIVVRGAINGRVGGPLPNIIDVPETVNKLLRLSKCVDISSPKLLSPRPRSSLRQGYGGQAGQADKQHRVLVEFFYAAGCDECGEMEDEVLPDLRRRFGDRIDLREYDIYDKENYVRLARLQEKLKVRTNEKVSIYLNKEIHLGGLKTIKQQLFGRVEQLLAKTEPPAFALQVSQTAAIESEKPGAEDDILVKRSRTFTVGGILVAGLVDGVNPCAFASIIFFVTLLSVTRKKRADLILVGIGFCLAVFATYLLIGLGAFRVFLKLNASRFLSEALRWVMVIILFALSIVSFKDAWIFCKTGRARDVTLQLPDGVKRRIHEIMRRGLSLRSLLIGSLMIGFLVTLLETVCTGQVYVPTLVFLTRSPEVQGRAWALLVLYNLMFIVPLIIVFTATYRGTRNERFIEWSRKNVVWGKTLLGLFFAALALVMVWV